MQSSDSYIINVNSPAPNLHLYHDIITIIKWHTHLTLSQPPHQKINRITQLPWQPFPFWPYQSTSHLDIQNKPNLHWCWSYGEFRSRLSGCLSLWWRCGRGWRSASCQMLLLAAEAPNSLLYCQEDIRLCEYLGRWCCPSCLNACCNRWLLSPHRGTRRNASVYLRPRSSFPEVGPLSSLRRWSSKQGIESSPCRPWGCRSKIYEEGGSMAGR